MILACFAKEEDLLKAAHRLRAENVGEVETYTPGQPSEHAPSDTQNSYIPLLVLFAAMFFAAGSLAVQTVTAVWSYPFDVGGHPYFSWPAFVPTFVENSCLLTVFAGFFAYLAVTRLPRLYAPIDESEAFRRASRDRYFLAVREPDAPRVRHLLAEHKPELIEEVQG